MTAEILHKVYLYTVTKVTKNPIFLFKLTFAPGMKWSITLVNVKIFEETLRTSFAHSIRAKIGKV